MTESKQINILGIFNKLLNTGWLPRLTFLGMIVLKLTGLLTWSWLMVLSPLIAIAALPFIMIAVLILISITYPIWNPLINLLRDTIKMYRKDKKRAKESIKWASLTKAKTAWHFVERTLKLIFVG